VCLTNDGYLLSKVLNKLKKGSGPIIRQRASELVSVFKAALPGYNVVLIGGGDMGIIISSQWEIPEFAVTDDVFMGMLEGPVELVEGLRLKTSLWIPNVKKLRQCSWGTDVEQRSQRLLSLPSQTDLEHCAGRSFLYITIGFKSESIVMSY